MPTRTQRIAITYKPTTEKTSLDYADKNTADNASTADANALANAIEGLNKTLKDAKVSFGFLAPNIFGEDEGMGPDELAGKIVDDYSAIREGKLNLDLGKTGNYDIPITHPNLENLTLALEAAKRGAENKLSKATPDKPVVLDDVADGVMAAIKAGIKGFAKPHSERDELKPVGRR